MQLFFKFNLKCTKINIFLKYTDEVFIIFYYIVKKDVFIWEFIKNSALKYAPQIACLPSLHLWVIYFGFTRLRFAGKLIVFRGIIRYHALNHLNITTISWGWFPTLANSALCTVSFFVAQNGGQIWKIKIHLKGKVQSITIFQTYF